MDNNLLKQLISQHKRVVIPEFGAFLKKETPGGEELVFSPFLRKDDGVVTDAIVREYGVETEDARAMVAEFVIYLRQSLASSGRYHIEGMGTLAADANGAVTLREEEPEPQHVAPQPIVVQSVQPVVPQQIYAQPQSQVQRAAAPASQLAMTRPQSIQVQPPMPQQVPPSMGQPVAQQQPQPMVPRQVFGQPQQVMPQQSQPQPIQQQMPAMGQPGQQQRPYPFQQGQPLQQQPVAPPQSQRPPQQQQVQQPQPQRMGRPMTQSSPQMPQQSMMLPQQQPLGAPPARGPQGPGVPGGGGRPNANRGGRQRPPLRNKPPKTKADVWLIVAIVAALVVIAIMVYGFLNADNAVEIDLGAITPMSDTVTTQLPEGM